MVPRSTFCDFLIEHPARLGISLESQPRQARGLRNHTIENFRPWWQEIEMSLPLLERQKCFRLLRLGIKIAPQCHHHRNTTTASESMNHVEELFTGFGCQSLVGPKFFQLINDQQHS